MSSRLRLILACVLFSSWMVLLLTGIVGGWLGGWLHLLLLSTIAIFPWREARTGVSDDET